jgi:secretion/DNA translocation related TadE-like protein
MTLRGARAAPKERAGGSSLRSEHGAGTVAALGVVSATLLCAGLSLPIGAALVVKQRLEAAADAAALAAADTATGFSAGYPCDAAAQAAALNGAQLAECSVEGLVATVQVRGQVLGLDVIVAARAGPPGTP